MMKSFVIEDGDTTLNKHFANICKGAFVFISHQKIQRYLVYILYFVQNCCPGCPVITYKGCQQKSDA